MFTILVVDDDAMSVALLTAQLLQIKNRNFNVIPATSPAEALRLMNDSVRLIISDMYMPGMNGIELIKSIKLKYPLIKAVLISATENMTDLTDTKIDKAIQKPFHVADLAYIVELLDKTNFDSVIDRIQLDIAEIRNSICSTY